MVRAGGSKKGEERLWWWLLLCLWRGEPVKRERETAPVRICTTTQDDILLNRCCFHSLDKKGGLSSSREVKNVNFIINTSDGLNQIPHLLFFPKALVPSLLWRQFSATTILVFPMPKDVS